ncbi:hypothetical protein TetV_336 [Tetraselmis virus 1]|uniref:Uncharacterized protein n=1 Tax=Tetraselmis virus 1 TaxID=2060617 RepID=A0A2P0VNE9_9VIRU|nr:hypothetical protein QJ968_gp336 [Tetraselmis virus 1]AUF82428.1 hypothetical protein TetV_336 [Tetraselmis virus 1]
MDKEEIDMSAVKSMIATRENTRLSEILQKEKEKKEKKEAKRAARRKAKYGDEEDY